MVRISDPDTGYGGGTDGGTDGDSDGGGGGSDGGSGGDSGGSGGGGTGPGGPAGRDRIDEETDDDISIDPTDDTGTDDDSDDGAGGTGPGGPAGRDRIDEETDDDISTDPTDDTTDDGTTGVGGGIDPDEDVPDAVQQRYGEDLSGDEGAGVGDRTQSRRADIPTPSSGEEARQQTQRLQEEGGIETGTTPQGTDVTPGLEARADAFEDYLVENDPRVQTGADVNVRFQAGEGLTAEYTDRVGQRQVDEARREFEQTLDYQTPVDVRRGRDYQLVREDGRISADFQPDYYERVLQRDLGFRPEAGEDFTLEETDEGGERVEFTEGFFERRVTEEADIAAEAGEDFTIERTEEGGQRVQLTDEGREDAIASALLSRGEIEVEGESAELPLGSVDVQRDSGGDAIGIEFGEGDEPFVIGGGTTTREIESAEQLEFDEEGNLVNVEAPPSPSIGERIRQVEQQEGFGTASAVFLGGSLGALETTADVAGEGARILNENLAQPGGDLLGDVFAAGSAGLAAADPMSSQFTDQSPSDLSEQRRQSIGDIQRGESGEAIANLTGGDVSQVEEDVVESPGVEATEAIATGALQLPGMVISGIPSLAEGVATGTGRGLATSIEAGEEEGVAAGVATGAGIVGETAVGVGETVAVSAINRPFETTGQLVGSGAVFGAARAAGPRASLGTRAAVQPGEELLGYGGYGLTRRVAGERTAQRFFPNQEPLIFSEEAAIRSAQRVGGGIRRAGGRVRRAVGGRDLPSPSLSLGGRLPSVEVEQDPSAGLVEVTRAGGRSRSVGERAGELGERAGRGIAERGEGAGRRVSDLEQDITDTLESFRPREAARRTGRRVGERVGESLSRAETRFALESDVAMFNLGQRARPGGFGLFESETGARVGEQVGESARQVGERAGELPQEIGQELQNLGLSGEIQARNAIRRVNEAGERIGTESISAPSRAGRRVGERVGESLSRAETRFALESDVAMFNLGQRARPGGFGLFESETGARVGEGVSDVPADVGQRVGDIGPTVGRAGERAGRQVGQTTDAATERLNVAGERLGMGMAGAPSRVGRGVGETIADVARAGTDVTFRVELPGRSVPVRQLEVDGPVGVTFEGDFEQGDVPWEPPEDAPTMEAGGEQVGGSIAAPQVEAEAGTGVAVQRVIAEPEVETEVDREPARPTEADIGPRVEFDDRLGADVTAPTDAFDPVAVGLETPAELQEPAQIPTELEREPAVERGRSELEQELEQEVESELEQELEQEVEQELRRELEVESELEQETELEVELFDDREDPDERAVFDEMAGVAAPDYFDFRDPLAGFGEVIETERGADRTSQIETVLGGR